MIRPWGHRSRHIEELRKEKLEAIAICDRAIAKLKTISMASEDRDYFVRRMQQARDFGIAYLLTINVVHALYQIVGEHHDKSIVDPRTTLREELNRFLAHADVMELHWGTEFYRRFAPKMREFAATFRRSTTRTMSGSCNAHKSYREKTLHSNPVASVRASQCPYKVGVSKSKRVQP